MTEWLSSLQGASFLGLLIVTTFAGLQRGRLQNLKETVEGLRGDLSDYDKREERRDREHADELAKRDGIQAADGKRITDLEAEVAALRRTVTGEVHLAVIEGSIADMASSLTAHHTDAMAGAARLESAISDLAKAVRQNRGTP